MFSSLMQPSDSSGGSCSARAPDYGGSGKIAYSLSPPGRTLGGFCREDGAKSVHQATNLQGNNRLI
jgi:hypothetical protein